MGSRSYKSAIVIIPPERCWPQIQQLRKQYDKAYKRWMPHINLVYPFMEDKLSANQHSLYQSVVSTLSVQLSNIKPFSISFNKNSLGTFAHGRTSTMWVKPLIPPKRLSPRLFSPKTEKRKPAKKVERDSGKIKRKQDVVPLAVKPHVVPMPASSSTNCDLHGAMKKPADIASVTSGWESLASAIWLPETTTQFSKIPPPGVTGIDALRYAVWTPDGAITEPSRRDESSYVTFANLSSTEMKSSRRSSSESSDATSSGNEDDEWDAEITSDEEEDSESDTSESDNSDDKESHEYHPSVMELQTALEHAYPGYNEQRSPEGFKPHLTLGQYRAGEESRFKSIQDTWQDIEFEVRQIHIISRPDDLTPFSIKKSIPLGLMAE